MKKKSKNNYQVINSNNIIIIEGSLAQIVEFFIIDCGSTQTISTLKTKIMQVANNKNRTIYGYKIITTN